MFVVYVCAQESRRVRFKTKTRATESKGDRERVKARLTDRMSTRVRNIMASRCSSWSSKGGNRCTELSYFMNLPEPF